MNTQTLPAPHHGVRQTLVFSRGQLTHPQSDWVAEEVPVALVFNGLSHVVMMASPKELTAFALGFSLSEGIIDSPQQIYSIEIVSVDNGIEVQIEIASRCFMNLKARRRALTGRTGCGVCGVEQINQVMRPLSPLPFSQSFNLSYLDAALTQLRQVQTIGNLTGCTHAAIWLNPHGQRLGGCEDIGRHVALDKLLGQRAQHGWQQGALLISSRASYEMVQKSAACGVEILLACSAVTQLAIDVASRCHLTLVGFSQPGRAVIFTHPRRLYERSEANNPE